MSDYEPQPEPENTRHEEEYWEELKMMIEENGISAELAGHLMFEYVKRQKDIRDGLW